VCGYCLYETSKSIDTGSLKSLHINSKDACHFYSTDQCYINFTFMKVTLPIFSMRDGWRPRWNWGWQWFLEMKICILVSLMNVIF